MRDQQKVRERRSGRGVALFDIEAATAQRVRKLADGAWVDVRAGLRPTEAAGLLERATE